MKRLRFWVMVCGCLLFTLTSALGQAKSYLIERGDVLDVMVMEHPEFSLTGIIVLPDGTMQYPGIGSIQAAGMSSEALTASVEKSVGKYVVNKENAGTVCRRYGDGKRARRSELVEVLVLRLPPNRFCSHFELRTLTKTRKAAVGCLSCFLFFLLAVAVLVLSVPVAVRVFVAILVIAVLSLRGGGV